MYKRSDMYTPADYTWKNFQIDWKCLGLLICFVVDGTVDSRYYHCMISSGHINQSNPFVSHSFVKSLLEGKWSQDWPDFRQQYLQTHPLSNAL